MSLEPDAVSRRLAAHESVARLNALIWGGFALLCFALAAYLTRVVVRGDYQPIGLANTQIFVPYVRRADAQWRAFPAPPPPPPPPGMKLPGSVIGSSPPPGTIDTYRLMTLAALLYVNFRSEGKNAIMSVRVPPGLDVRLVTNHLTGANPCTLYDQDQVNPTTMHVVEVTSDERQIGRVWMISLAPQAPRDILIPGAFGSPQPWVPARAEIDASQLLECTIDLPTEWETFASRRMAIGEPNLYNIGSKNTPPAALQNYVPVSNIGVDFEGIAGFEGLQFIGGFSFVGNPGVESPEQWRTIGLGSTAEVTWRDLGREGERDGILVIIGALIAIGAAMAVEAVRPYIDRYVEAREKSADLESLD